MIFTLYTKTRKQLTYGCMIKICITDTHIEEEIKPVINVIQRKQDQNSALN